MAQHLPPGVASITRITEHGVELDYIVYCRGLQEWRLQTGELHREGDEPARVKPDGSSEWFHLNKRHRPGGKPSWVMANGGRQFHVNGRLHNPDGPAVVKPNGFEGWFLDGYPHRVDGPALINPVNERTAWMIHGKPSRTGGEPAIVTHYGPNRMDQEWLVDGKYFREDESKPTFITTNGLFQRHEWREGTPEKWELNRVDGPAKMEYFNGTLNREEWCLNGRIHNPNGPAVAQYGITKTQAWWWYGKRSRLDGPAVVIERGDGTRYEEYWLDDELHNLEGPARTSRNSREPEYWIHGKRFRLDEMDIYNLAAAVERARTSLGADFS